MKKLSYPLLLAFLIVPLLACQAQEASEPNKPNQVKELKDTAMERTTREYPEAPRQLTKEQWKQLLTEAEYRVLRENGTERPGTGQLDKHFAKGTYLCAGCGKELFASDAKFDSGCGWPAFYKSSKEGEENPIEYVKDTSHGMVRTEVRCKHCDSHLGHVFYGEKFGNPVDTRYCINSVSLDFVAEDEQAKDQPESKTSPKTEEKPSDS